MDNREIRDFIHTIFEGYKKRKNNNTLYNIDSQIPENIIKAYYSYTEKISFDEIVEKFKQKYIYNESRVERNITMEEQAGLSEVYDYINNFNFNEEKFNIFVQSLCIHQKLYSKCNDTSFGGKLRDSEVFLYDSSVEVLPPKDAIKFFQKFLGDSDKIMKELGDKDIFEYINDCVKITTELIKAQPFSDGNKRTFRALLNLLFKSRGLPPVYIEVNEREEYKDALLKAMINNDYSSLNKFYYYKVCDSIYELDIEPTIKKEKTIKSLN